MTNVTKTSQMSSNAFSVTDGGGSAGIKGDAFRGAAGIVGADGTNATGMTSENWQAKGGK